MGVDIRENKPWSVNQIDNTKPNVAKTDTPLSGYVATSLNGGHNKVIFYKQIMAGEKHKEFRLNASIKMLTPKTPAYQNLTMTIRTYFVPNSRVWENAEKYTAQKGGTAEIKIAEIPNLGNYETPIILSDDSTECIALQNTTWWRDTFISSYMPRFGRNERLDAGNDQNLMNRFPKVSVLPLRGRIAIYNDFERNKEYDTELVEYKDDTVSQAEFNRYVNTTADGWAINSMRAKKNNSYYSNYRTELQGFEEEYPPNEMSSDTALMNWAQWEMKIAEARSQAENAQLNDWDVIAKIRGSKRLSEGKVQLIGQRSVNLNYSSVTQNTYSANENIQEMYRELGQQGAFSYTNIDMPLFAGFEFIEEGYIHVIATVSADSVYEGAFDRLEMNITPLDQYRPDMLEDKKDVLYMYELGTQTANDFDFFSEIVGFKRKYSEYFKMQNQISGDMTTENYMDVKSNYGTIEWDGTIVETQKTYQFFETSANFFESEYRDLPKNIWKDYTDMLIDKNQASKNAKEFYEEQGEVRIRGNNQIIILGKCYCNADLPIDQSIKDNYTTWGEH